MSRHWVKRTYPHLHIRKDYDDEAWTVLLQRHRSIGPTKWDTVQANSSWETCRATVVRLTSRRRAICADHRPCYHDGLVWRHENDDQECNKLNRIMR